MNASIHETIRLHFPRWEAHGDRDRTAVDMLRRAVDMLRFDCGHNYAQIHDAFSRALGRQIARDSFESLMADLDELDA